MSRARRADDPFPVKVNGEVRDGWTSAALGDLVQPSPEKIEPQDAPRSKYLSLEHVESGSHRILGRGLGSDVGSTKAVFRRGDVLYGKLRPYLNKVCIPDFDGICSTDFLVFRPSPALDQRLLMHFLSQPGTVEYANHHSSGVQLPRVSFEKLAELEVPIPPLAEQKRIVAKVEELLARVNAARERLARVPAILKRFRQAVLSAACDGRLTEEWRGSRHGERGVGPASLAREALQQLPESWRWVRFGDLLRELRNGLSPRPHIEPPGHPILRISAVRSALVDLEDHRYLRDAKGSIEQYRLEDGDLLFTRYNGSLDLLGVCGMVKGVGRRTILYPDKLMRVRLGETVRNSYAEAFFGSPGARERLTGGAKSSAGQQGVSGQDLKNQAFALPPLAEQDEIVRRVEALFKLADVIEKRVAVATARAEKLTQAILAKAFCGELVPTEAELARREGREYEPAADLLERIARTRAL